MPLRKAKPGMKLALPVRNPQAADRNLLAVGFELNDQTIQRLIELGVRDLWVRYPQLSVLEQYVNPEVLRRRQNLATRLASVFESNQKQANVKMQYTDYLAEVGSLVQSLLDNPATVMFLDEAADDGESLIHHSSTVAYLSVLMGLKLDWYLIKQRKRLPPAHAKQVGELGVGALLHDVGMRQIDPPVARNHRDSLDADDRHWRSHALRGYYMVRGQVAPTAAIVVLDHHQHYDGSGFPEREGTDGRRAPISGNRIHIFARIVTVADTFAHWRYPGGAEPVPTVRVLKRMLSEPYINWFDPQVLGAFLSVVPPFPPGTIVQLSDGRYAVPIDHCAYDPCRPTVRLLDSPDDLCLDDAEPAAHRDASATDDEEDRPDDQIIDLCEQTDLSIVMAEDQDVRKDNFELPDLNAAATLKDKRMAAAAKM